MSTDDLLSDLKQDLADDIAAERARRAAEEAARAAAEAEAARRAETARRAEIEARLEAERRRRAMAHDLRAARIAPSAAPSPTPSFDADRRHADGARASTAGVAPALEPLPPVEAERHGPGFYAVVVGLPLVCLTAIAIAWIMRPVPAPAPASPITIGQPSMPVAPMVAAPGDAVEAAITPTRAAAHDEETVEADDAAPERAATPRPAKRPTPAPRVRPTRKAAEDKPPRKPRLFDGASMEELMGAE